MINVGERLYFSLNSIQNRIFLSILLFLILPTLFTFSYLGEQQQQSVVEKMDASRKDSLNQVGLSLESMGNKMVNSIIALTIDENTIRMLKDPEEHNEYEKMKISTNMIRALTNTYLADFEHYITVLDFKGNLYTNWYAPYGTYERLLKDEWFTEMRGTNAEIVWKYQTNNYTYKDSRPLVTIARLVQGIGSSSGYGIALISIPESEFAKLLRGLPGNNLLIDSQGVILSRSGLLIPAAPTGTNDPIIRQAVADDVAQSASKVDLGGTIQFNRNITNTGWKLVQLISYMDMYGEIDKIRLINYLLICTIFLIFTIISLFISLRISRPLKLLNKKMVSIGANGFNSMIQVKGLDEIAGLIRAYNQMLQQIKALLNRLKLEYEMKQELRFKMLQAQINPHFILNTLNNIKWMAYLKNNREVGNMLTSLAVIMETSLGRDEAIIVLRKEIEYIHHYTTLQKIKYNERLVVEYDIPDILDACEVIPFILQPIVENSIYHGIEKKIGTGHIRIRGFKEQDDLVIIIEDDGLGMKAEELESLHQTLAEADAPVAERIGISNVHQRIRLHYGSGYGIRVDSRPDQGTQVKIILPYRVRVAEGGIFHVEGNGR
jgi:two-component system sensor histidine kinase YesM